MAERNLKVRLGAFFVLSLASLAGLVVLFGGAPRMFSTQVGYTIVFAEAPGLAVGTPVRKSGVRIGEVSKIDLDPNSGEVNVGILVDPRHLPRPSEIATIARGILNGDTTLDFVPREVKLGVPVPPAAPYPPGTRFSGETPINARGLLSQASDILPTAQESLLRIQKSFQRFEEATPRVENALDEIADAAAAAEELIQEFRVTNTKFQELLGNTEPAIPADRVVAQIGPLPGVQPPPGGNPKIVPVPIPVPGEQPTVRAALAEIIALLRDIRPVSEELERLLKTDGRELGRAARSVQATADNVNAFLTPENQKSVANILKNLDEASGDLTKTIRLAAILLDQAERTLKNLNDRITQTEKLFTNLETASKPFADNADTIVRDAQSTVRTLNAAADELNAALTDVRNLVKLASTSEGTVKKLLTDPALFNNLNAAAFEAARTLIRVEKIAKDLEVFADKVARKPEVLGLGGVARPSTGLKDSPTAPLQPVTPLVPIAPLPPGTQAPAPVVPYDQPVVRPIPPLPGGAAPVVPAFRPANDRPAAP